MFCPLCKSEYRQGVTACATCDAALLPSLDAPEVYANPAILLWTGKEETQFAAVAGALKDARIPALVHEHPRAALGNRWRPESQIRVLQSDLKRALQIAAAAAESFPRAFHDFRNCHGCGEEVRVTFTHCPRCGTMLIASKDTASPDSRSVVRSEALFCPLCDAEYGPAHTHCTLCGVDLVPEHLRGRPFDEKDREERLELIWRGNDPVAVSRVIAALRGARIRHHVKPTQDHLAFELGIPRPRYEVRVFASDAPAAGYLVAPIRESLPFASFEEKGRPDSDEIPTLPSAGNAAAQTEWKPAQATLEVWSSDDSALARLLQDCLSENRIGVRSEGHPPGMLRLFVRPQEEAVAREIIREVIQGTPPA
jgi:predicted amidophosphoribosyltransferase